MQLKIIPYQLDNSITLPGCVLVGGCFDLLHYGHLNFLKASAKLGSLVVALESDRAIKLRKGSSPIHTQQQRAEILAELHCVATVILLPMLKTYEDYCTLVLAIQPSVLAITQGDPQTDNKKKQAAAINAKLVEVNNLIEGLSSTLIKANHL
ncbi:MAG: adenylyltransferase/cytidyltransferase family protein [Candidatus Paracaedibacteraceae bacterium]|nr:adenylyltransferase/cytidyltransferase family protein [Candidatus Paracaedibacteraceae bacterium]